MRLSIIIIATATCLTTGAQARHHHHTQLSLYGMSRGIHRHHTAPTVHAAAPGLQVRHHEPAPVAEPVTTVQKPAEYKLVKVHVVSPLVFDHSLLFDPAPRLPTDHFSKAAPWAGTLSY
jgi:hypothetical protein